MQTPPHQKEHSLFLGPNCCSIPILIQMKNQFFELIMILFIIFKVFLADPKKIVSQNMHNDLNWIFVFSNFFCAKNPTQTAEHEYYNCNKHQYRAWYRVIKLCQQTDTLNFLANQTCSHKSTSHWRKTVSSIDNINSIYRSFVHRKYDTACDTKM